MVHDCPPESGDLGEVIGRGLVGGDHDGPFGCRGREPGSDRSDVVGVVGGGEAEEGKGAGQLDGPDARAREKEQEMSNEPWFGSIVAACVLVEISATDVHGEHLRRWRKRQR